MFAPPTMCTRFVLSQELCAYCSANVGCCVFVVCCPAMSVHGNTPQDCAELRRLVEKSKLGFTFRLNRDGTCMAFPLNEYNEGALYSLSGKAQSRQQHASTQARDNRNVRNGQDGQDGQ